MGRAAGTGAFVAATKRWSAPMSKQNDLSKSLVALDQDATLIAVVEMEPARSKLCRQCSSSPPYLSTTQLIQKNGTLKQNMALQGKVGGASRKSLFPHPDNSPRASKSRRCNSRSARNGASTRTGLRRHGRLNRLSAGSPQERDGFEPEIRFSVLPSTQSETPVPPKIHFETNPLRIREKHTLVSLPYRLFATP